MNELKILAGFIFGVGVGILGSKRFFEEKYKRIADEEIASVRANMGRRGHILEQTSLEEPEVFEKKVKKELEKPDPKFYSSIDNMYQTTENVVAAYAKERYAAESEHPEDDKAEEAYVISEEEYSETALSYDKICLHYSIDDDMLLDADSGEWSSQVSSDMEGVIRDSDKSELYFRDDSIGTDFEVIRIKGAYYIDV